MPSNPNLQPIRKRKKNAPDRQQPEWLFPTPEENPAPKPHQEPSAKEMVEKEKSIDFLKRRSVGAPSKSAPPIALLNLIAMFLAEYNFLSTGRLFAAERQGRSKIDGWKDEIGGKLEKGMPTLNKIYKEWRKEWDERRLLDMTSSDDEDDAATKREKMLKKKNSNSAGKQKSIPKDDSTSSDGSSSSDDSDAEMADAPAMKKPGTKKSSSDSSSSSASSSDSDADDENEAKVTKVTSARPKSPTLKRKASASDSSSASDPSSSSEEEAHKSKKAKTTAAKPARSSSESSSGSSSSSDEEEAAKPAIVESTKSTVSHKISSPADDTNSNSDSSISIAKKTALPVSSSESSSESSDSDDDSPAPNKKSANGSDSSATLSDAKKSSSSSSQSGSSSSESDTVPKKTRAELSSARQPSPPLPPTPVAKLPLKKTKEPFSRIPKDIKVDERLASNAYVPYEYAQKAHQDLIVTKGKGFTKEKNKKKRGSYKGGYIDVEGKKGIRFED